MLSYGDLCSFLGNELCQAAPKVSGMKTKNLK